MAKTILKWLGDFQAFSNSSSAGQIKFDEIVQNELGVTLNPDGTIVVNSNANIKISYEFGMRQSNYGAYFQVGVNNLKSAVKPLLYNGDGVVMFDNGKGSTNQYKAFSFLGSTVTIADNNGGLRIDATTSSYYSVMKAEGLTFEPFVAGDIITLNQQNRSITSTWYFGENSYSATVGSFYDGELKIILETEEIETELPPTELPQIKDNLILSGSQIAYDVYSYGNVVDFAPKLETQIRYSDLNIDEANGGTLNYDLQGSEYEISCKDRRHIAKLLRQENLFFVRRINSRQGETSFPLFPTSQKYGLNSDGTYLIYFKLTDWVGQVERTITGTNYDTDVLYTQEEDPDTGKVYIKANYEDGRNSWQTTGTITQVLNAYIDQTLITPLKLVNTEFNNERDETRKFAGLFAVSYPQEFNDLTTEIEFSTEYDTDPATGIKTILELFNQKNVGVRMLFNGNVFSLEFYIVASVVLDVNVNARRFLSLNEGVNTEINYNTSVGIGEGTNIVSHSNAVAPILTMGMKRTEVFSDFESDVGNNVTQLSNAVRRQFKENFKGWEGLFIFDTNSVVGHINVNVGDIVEFRYKGVSVTNRVKGITEIFESNAVYFGFDME